MTADPLTVRGKVVLITGAAGGIGRALVQGFVEAGASVVAADRDEAAVKELGVALGRRGLTIDPVGLDVTDTAGAEQALDGLDRLDVLVNNAGVKSGQTIVDGDRDVWQRTLDINAHSVLTLSRLAITRHLRDTRGSIVNIGSSVSSRAAVLNYQAGGADYCLSKAMVHSITQLLAYEAAPYGITVNAIAPGIIDTPLHGRPTAETEAKHAGKIPLGRVGQPEDLVGPALFLAAPGANYVTGQILHVNGGMVMEP